MKTGVLFCTCNGRVDVRYKDVKKVEGAEVVELVDVGCGESGLEVLKRDIERNDLDSVVVGCSYGGGGFVDACSEVGVKPENVGFVNLRDLCLSVGGKEGVEAAKRAVAGEIEKLSSLEHPRDMAVNIGESVFVVGGGDVVDRVVDYLSRDLDVVQLVPEDIDVGYERLVGGQSVYQGDVFKVEGRVGGLEVGVSKESAVDLDMCIGCDRCRLECDLDAFTSGYRVLDVCDECMDCVDVCPVDAIEIGRNEKRLFETDQVLFSEDSLGLGVDELPSGVYVLGEDGLEGVSSVLERAGGFRKDVWLDVKHELCNSVGPGGSEGCSYCMDLCPADAVWIDGEGVHFDRVECTGCGLCSSICPLSVPNHKMSNKSYFNVVDSVLYEKGGLLRKDPLDKHVVLFGSREGLREYGKAVRSGVEVSPYIPIEVRPGSLSAALVVYTACKADGVVVLGQVSPAVDMAQAIVDELGVGRVGVMAGGVDVSWLDMFYRSVVTGNRIGVSRPDSYENREALVGLLEELDVEGVVEGRYSFGFVDVSGDCTLCNACANACQTGALIRKDNELVFRHERCTGCGLCIEVCPEDAVDIDYLIDFDSLGVDVGLVESEMMCCKECGKEFISMEAYRKVVDSLESAGGSKSEDRVGLIEYCEDCRPMVALRDLGSPGDDL
ncbi:4Fe-4S binding protein [Methanonatronarchaeum thermophilum]|uniref:4Fe-4S binding protein n=1 Tax=Methanonatronarchaeum thermophilum TaxID=1927129 RepID=UPI0013747D97|nr:4Fe-4S binding protein [Methanonatronarchaeum thermophilum]